MRWLRSLRWARWTRWVWAPLAAGTVTLVVWPLNAPGVTGNPFAPHFREFGWYSYQPLPDHPTLADFRRAGIPLPQDAVHRRRVEAAAAVVLTGAAIGWSRRGRRPTHDSA